MIISHTHKYVFVELPRTGSTAIRKELRRSYGAVPILLKHSTYDDFLKVAGAEERKYFVFSCIRNPMDSIVSHFFKCKNNHGQRFTDPVKLGKNKGITASLDNKFYDFIKKNNADFPTFFMKFYRIPYNNWANLSHRKFDFVIRFENLQEDFATALQLIGIRQKRPLPVLNKTSSRENNYLAYYTPETIVRAKRVFGPFMKQWGYEFPPEWGETPVPWWNQMEFDLFGTLANVYWRYLKFRV